MQKGFSLLEFVIYCAIAISLAGFLVSAAMHAIREKDRLDELGAIERSARLTEKILTEKIRSASTLDNPLSSTTSTILTLSYATGTTPVIFSLNDGYIEIAEGAGTPQRITDTDNVVTKLEFYGTSSTSTKGFVRTTFTLKNGAASKDFILMNNIYAH
jgi:type II secretory pathway pseudopilin PulG